MPKSTRKKSKTGTCHVMLRVNTESPVHYYNLYSISSNGGSAHSIKDVSITKERGISWDYNINIPFQYNIKRSVPWK